ncbi:MAG: hypothetical protein ACOCXT_04565 [Candidatus Dojkabacteria bacterium]
MNTSTKLIPSILSSKLHDYQHFAQIYRKFSSVIHIDIMDGKYVPARSPELYQILQQLCKVPVVFFVHIMVENVAEYLQIAAKCHQVKLVYVHIEKVTQEILEQEWPFAIALTVNPDTPLDSYKDTLLQSKVIQIMSVVPGRQGAPFIPATLTRIHDVRKSGFTGGIHIDGSVDAETIPEMADYQPDILTVGSAVQRSKDPETSFLQLQELLTGTMQS